jgi:uncharacterized iron-regulated membrane protein
VSLWRRWLRQPQSVWLRKALFQIHLWIGIALGLYIVVLGITGSALVFRDELTEAWETPLPEYREGAKPMSRAELTAAAERLYPGYTATRVGNRFSRRRPVIEIWLERAGEKREQLFNPYTGEDVGEALPRGLRAILWTADLHDNLLAGETGKRVNGIGSALVALLAVSGIVIWWPGVQRWKRAIGVSWRSRWSVFNFDLHSALGFWFFGIIALWGLSGIYLAFPEPFSDYVDSISDPDAILGDRPGDIVLRWFVRLHFGRWEGLPWLSALWVVAGLVPVIMFITGAVMWWNRVFRQKAQGPRLKAQDPTAVVEP